MSDNVIPFPDDPSHSRSAGAVPCPTSSLLTHLTLLDGRLVNERHEILVFDLSGRRTYSDGDDDHD